MALERALDVRYAGQAYELNVPFVRDWRARFPAHAERFGHADATRQIEVVTVRARARGGGASVPRSLRGADRRPSRGVPYGSTDGVAPPRCIGAGVVRGLARGPAIVCEYSATTGVPPVAGADRGRAAACAGAASEGAGSVDPLGLELANHRLAAIAEDGVVLGRTLSPNIKERRDYSCAAFDGAGAVAHAAHIPVHLG